MREDIHTLPGVWLVAAEADAGAVCALAGATRIVLAKSVAAIIIERIIFIKLFPQPLPKEFRPLSAQRQRGTTMGVLRSFCLISFRLLSDFSPIFFARSLFGCYLSAMGGDWNGISDHQL